MWHFHDIAQGEQNLFAASKPMVSVRHCLKRWPKKTAGGKPTVQFIICTKAGCVTTPYFPYFGAFAALKRAINCWVEASKLSLSASP